MGRTGLSAGAQEGKGKSPAAEQEDEKSILMKCILHPPKHKELGYAKRWRVRIPPQTCRELSQPEFAMKGFALQYFSKHDIAQSGWRISPHHRLWLHGLSHPMPRNHYIAKCLPFSMSYIASDCIDVMPSILFM